MWKKEKKEEKVIYCDTREKNFKVKKTNIQDTFNYQLKIWMYGTKKNWNDM